MVNAFWTYPETVHLLPREVARRRTLPLYLRSDAKDALRFGLLLGADVDGAVVGVAHTSVGFGELFRRLQTGYVRTYAATTLAGLVVLLVVVLAVQS